MIYHCNACRFNFERYSAVSACPDCGKQDIREANAGEKAEVIRYRKEFGPVIIRHVKAAANNNDLRAAALK